MEPKSGQRKNTSDRSFSPMPTKANRTSVSLPIAPVEEKRGKKRGASGDIGEFEQITKKIAQAPPKGSIDKTPVPVIAPRQTRSGAREQRLRDEYARSDTRVPKHFGHNVSPYVQSAIAQGGSLAEDSRHTMKGEINRLGLRTGDSWQSVLPTFMANHLSDHPTGAVFSQQDNRVGARKSSTYSGFMITSTRVNVGHGDVADDKTIAEPSSPKPHGSNDRSHASPFALAGADTNRAKTVWAPKWANITVDGHIEHQAKAEPSKATTFHFRYDTDKHSTVGFASHNPSTGVFRSVSTNYQRRGFSAQTKAPKGTRKKDK